MMGGEIAVQSELGKGTTFTVRLPAVVTGSKTLPLDTTFVPRERKFPKPLAGASKVLVIDADPAVQDLMSRYVFFQAQVCSAGADYPLKAVQPAPVFATTPGPYGVDVFGTWTISPGPTAPIVLKVAGPPIGSWLYIAGRDKDLPGGDPDIRVAITNGAGVTRVIKVVPVAYETATDTVRYVNRVEITRYGSKGVNKIAISGWDYEFPEGAFAYAVYDRGAGAPQKLVQVLDGADIGWFAHPPPFGPDSEVASFRFRVSGTKPRFRASAESTNQTNHGGPSWVDTLGARPEDGCVSDSRIVAAIPTTRPSHASGARGPACTGRTGTVRCG